MEFDGEKVKDMNEEEVQSKYGYVLFYKRRVFASSNIINCSTLN